MRTLEDLGRLPIIETSAFQSGSPAETLAPGLDPQRLVFHVSSGTTDEPLRVLRTTFEERLLQAFRSRVMFHLGFRLTDRRAAIVWEGPDRSERHLHEHLGLLSRLTIPCSLPADVPAATSARPTHR